MEENSAQHKALLVTGREFTSSAQYRSFQIGLTGLPELPKSKWNTNKSVCKRIWSWEHPQHALHGWVTIETGSGLPQGLHSSQQWDSIYCVLTAHLLASSDPPGVESVCSESTPWCAGAHTWPQLQHWWGHIHRPSKTTMIKCTGDSSEVPDSTSKNFWRSYQHSVLIHRQQPLFMG